MIVEFCEKYPKEVVIRIFNVDNILFTNIEMPALKLAHLGLPGFPKCLLDFSKLKTLDLSDNKITRLPAHTILHDLKYLEDLDVSNNFLHIFEDVQILGYLSNLKSLNFLRNPLPYMFNKFILIASLFRTVSYGINICKIEYKYIIIFIDAGIEFLQYPRKGLFPILKVLNAEPIRMKDLEHIVRDITLFRSKPEEKPKLFQPEINNHVVVSSMKSIVVIIV